MADFRARIKFLYQWMANEYCSSCAMHSCALESWFGALTPFVYAVDNYTYSFMPSWEPENCIKKYLYKPLGLERAPAVELFVDVLHSFPAWSPFFEERFYTLSGGTSKDWKGDVCIPILPTDERFQRQRSQQLELKLEGVEIKKMCKEILVKTLIDIFFQKAYMSAYFWPKEGFGIYRDMPVAVKEDTFGNLRTSDVNVSIDKGVINVDIYSYIGGETKQGKF